MNTPFKPNKREDPTCPTNGQHADWAMETVEVHAKFNGNVLADEGLETCMDDLLTDLRHLCHREGIDFDKAASASLDHFEAEK